jgi:hypothetical protein
MQFIHLIRRARCTVAIGISTLGVLAASQAFAAPDTTLAALAAHQAIAANVAHFSLRDQGRWEDLRNLFQPKGTISVTWYSGPIDGFIEASKKMASDSSSQSKHWIGTPRVTVCGERALSETDVTIMARATVKTVELDITSYARFFDRFERGADGAWRILSRTAIYEKDRIDPVAPSILFSLFYRFAGFDKYPAQYRHLAFGLEKNGYKLADGIIVTNSPEEAALKQSAMAWRGCS